MDERQKCIARLEAAILWKRPSGVTQIHCKREFHFDTFLKEVIAELDRTIHIKSIMCEPPTALEKFAILILDNHAEHQTDGFTIAEIISGKADEYLTQYHGLDLNDET